MVDGTFCRGELFGDFPPITIHHGGFVELEFKKVCRTGFIRSITPRALSERVINQMRTDDEPFDSFPIPNPHVEANASIVIGGRVMNSFVE